MPESQATSGAELARPLRIALTKSERVAALRRMSPDERLGAYRAGAFSLDTCCLWACLFEREVPRLNGEYEFIARSTPEVCDR
jgi:hypothetical protein